MNIFYLDKDPITAAVVQYNKHVVKMILESAQMLCAAHHILGDPDDVPYKLAHKNHPCTIWTRENSLHYDWLYEHMMALGNEYEDRYGRVHMSIDKCKHLNIHPEKIPHEPFEQPPQCMPDEYKDECSIQAYWNYYIGEKHVVANLKTEKLYEQRPKETY
jgi:hypothetical protein|tara:strand:- start:1533 stop:2012 length:480 start_codon:yes stop_codon:yes gene_type:complete